MILEAIEAHQFRNLSGTILCGSGLNIILGNNGQGKTNWLEAVYLLSRTKSFRTQRLQESIKFGEEMGFVRGKVSTGSTAPTRSIESIESAGSGGSTAPTRLTESIEPIESNGSGLERDLQVMLQGATKQISVNGKKEQLARYLSQFQVFAFTADELEVVRGTPEARRRFIDRGIASLKPVFVQTLSDYKRVLKQKNQVLQHASADELALAEVNNLLEPWNEQLVKLAALLHRARVEYVEQINHVLEPRLFEQRDLQVRYLSSLEGKGDLGDYESLLRQRLRLRLEAEVTAGRALIGPHRDDLEILLDGREMRVFGSSGQQRSALLLLDLAAISLYNLQRHEYPVFMIDDVDAELDEKRISSLLEYLEGRTQTFITTSKQSHLRRFISSATVFEIEEGKAIKSDLGRSMFSAALAP